MPDGRSTIRETLNLINQEGGIRNFLTRLSAAPFYAAIAGVITVIYEFFYGIASVTSAVIGSFSALFQATTGMAVAIITAGGEATVGWFAAWGSFFGPFGWIIAILTALLGLYVLFVGSNWLRERLQRNLLG